MQRISIGTCIGRALRGSTRNFAAGKYLTLKPFSDQSRCCNRILPTPRVPLSRRALSVSRQLKVFCFLLIGRYFLPDPPPSAAEPAERDDHPAPPSVDEQAGRAAAASVGPRVDADRGRCVLGHEHSVGCVRIEDRGFRRRRADWALQTWRK